jgi:hypothetical protein
LNAITIFNSFDKDFNADQSVQAGLVGEFSLAGHEKFEKPGRTRKLSSCTPETQNAIFHSARFVRHWQVGVNHRPVTSSSLFPNRTTRRAPVVFIAVMATIRMARQADGQSSKLAN